MQNREPTLFSQLLPSILMFYDLTGSLDNMTGSVQCAQQHHPARKGGGRHGTVTGSIEIGSDRHCADNGSEEFGKSK